MKKPLRTILLLNLVAMIMLGSFCGSSHGTPPVSVDGISLPEGFAITVFASEVHGARSLALGSGGTVFVGTRDHGVVYAVRDTDGDHSADTVMVIARNLNSPNGVAFRNGALYVAEISRILRFDDIENRLADPPTPVVVSGDFPADPHHGWKFIGFGPDHLLYVPVGAPCNVCRRDDQRYASIMRMNAEGEGLTVFAHGVRNTVGFDWHPITGVLWFTDNGRDHLGDDSPPDELNRAPTSGLHFGFPFVHGRAVRDPEFGGEVDASMYVPPVRELGPHVAALGMRFYTGSMFPEEYRNQIFIAEHGSWNRSEKIGYRVTLVRLDGDSAVSYEPFAEGWLEGERVRGRPVDLLVMPDGSLLVSDDFAGRIYRIGYGG